MKRSGLSIFFVTLAAGLSAPAETELYETVTNLWWNGPKTNIFAIADARLLTNTNDPAGVVLRMEGDFAFGFGSDISNAVNRFLSVGAQIQTPAFRVQFPYEAFNVSVLLDTMPSFTAAEWEQEHEYGAVLHKNMMFKTIWNSLENDGWLDTIPPSNVFDEQGILTRIPVNWRDPDIPLGKMLIAYLVHAAGTTVDEEDEVWTFFRTHSDSELLSEAQRRLAADSNDLVGSAFDLFVRFRGCDPSVLSNAVDRIAALSNAVERIRTIGASEMRSPFAEHWPWMSVYLDNVRIWLSGTNAIPFEESLHYTDLHSNP